jgi:hypothetical protein
MTNLVRRLARACPARHRPPTPRMIVGLYGCQSSPLTRLRAPRRSAPSSDSALRYTRATATGRASRCGRCLNTLTSLGVLPSACSKVHGDARLVPNGPCVVARLRKKNIQRTDLALSAVIHTDAHAPG